MPLTTADNAKVVLMQQELVSIMTSVSEISSKLQSLGVDAAIVPGGGTLDFSKESNSELIAVIAA
jgi:hypothetical protein